MDRLDANALGPDALAHALMQAEAPVVVKGATDAWQRATYGRLLSEHGELMIKVVLEGGAYRGEAAPELEMPIAGYVRSMAEGSLPDSAYIFHDVNATALATAASELGQTFTRVLERRKATLGALHPSHGRLLLSAGSWGNGRPFHAHGPALFWLLRGSKRWFVRRPNASFAWQTFEIEREDLQARSAAHSFGGRAVASRWRISSDPPPFSVPFRSHSVPLPRPLGRRARFFRRAGPRSSGSARSERASFSGCPTFMRTQRLTTRRKLLASRTCLMSSRRSLRYTRRRKRAPRKWRANCWARARPLTPSPRTAARRCTTQRGSATAMWPVCCLTAARLCMRNLRRGALESTPPEPPRSLPVRTQGSHARQQGTLGRSGGLS